jgi:predicted metalloprotease with PDZ domain
MNHAAFKTLVLFGLCFLAVNRILEAEVTQCELKVDLREVDRNIISATIKIPVKPGQLSLWYPKWLPGCHAPAGPIQNLAHFEVITDQGEILPWNRRTPEPYEFLLNVPDGVQAINVEIEYIVNQATTNSEGSDCAFEGSIGYFSFNSCIIYPTSSEHAYGKGTDLLFDVSLHLPADIQARGGIRSTSAMEDKIIYKSVPLFRLIDSPLILAEHINTIQLTEDNSSLKPHFLHVASRDVEDTKLPPEFVQGLKLLVAEAAEVFGEAPFEDYHFLVIIDDSLSDIGLEHSNSSLNTMSFEEIEDPGLRADWPAELLPHEYVHAWCGKYRIPKSMAQLDFHTDKDFKLLWVYEGLTEYYGTVLAARSGLVTKEEFLDHKAQRIHELSLQTGRKWRSLEDTAVMSHLLRDFSTYWQYRRRDQDYYDEGALYWWEADALIRQQSGGKTSLDDFCRSFFSESLSPTEGNFNPIAYREEDVYQGLGDIHKHDWPTFFQKRVKSTQKALNMRAVARSDYRLMYGDAPNEYQLRLESQYGYIDESACLGLFIGPEGSVTALVPNSPSDVAKLAEGDTITHMNGEKYDDTKLRQWLDENQMGNTLRLTIDRHGREFDVELAIGNPRTRYPFLEKRGDRDLIEEIITPKVRLLVP